MQLVTTAKKILQGKGKGRILKYEDYLAWFLVLFFAVIYSFMSINKHRLFETYGWDLGVFDHGIWQWSLFKIPYSSFHDLLWLADHFHIILITIVPLYWIWPSVKLLVSVQAVVTALGAIPLYYLSKKITKHRLFSIVVILGYLLFYSLQWHTFSGFHELAFLPLTLGAVMYFWETKNQKFYWLSFLLALLVKEEIGLLLAAFGLWAFLNDRKRWKQAMLSIVLGLGATAFLVGLIMPAIGDGTYRHSGFGILGETPLEVILNVLKNPLVLVRAFIDSPVKINTMFTAFWPWGFLPIFAPSTLILVFEQFASRFLDYAKTIRWTPYFAYSLPMATIMAWGSIYGFNNLKKKFKKKAYFAGSLIAIIIVGLIVAEDYFLHAPINSLFKRAFYRHESWMTDNLEVLKCVPDDVSVSAQNSLAPWLSQRMEIKVFPEGLNQGFEYIALDLHKGQSENSFSFFGSEKTRFVMNDLMERGFYEPVCSQGEAIVLKKIKDPVGRLRYLFPIEMEEK